LTCARHVNPMGADSAVSDVTLAYSARRVGPFSTGSHRAPRIVRRRQVSLYSNCALKPRGPSDTLGVVADTTANGAREDLNGA